MIYTNENTIITESTSNNTAITTQIVLKETEMIRTSFQSTLVKNSNNPECCLNGRLIHEKKGRLEISY